MAESRVMADMELKAFLAQRWRPFVLAVNQLKVKASTFSLMRKDAHEAAIILGTGLGPIAEYPGLCRRGEPRVKGEDQPSEEGHSHLGGK